MAYNLNDYVDRFTALQAPVWQTVSLTVSEQAGGTISFETPLITTSSPTELFTELQGPAIVVQFQFADTPDNSQVVLFPPDSAVEFTSALLDRGIDEMSDDLVQEIRPTLEAIVQGLCLGISQLRNEPFIAGGVTVRYQVFAFPPNLQVADHIVRTAITWRTEGAQGSLTWLLDDTTLEAIAAVGDDLHQQTAPTAEGLYPTAGSSALAPQPAPQLDPSIEILLDVPLDVTVELGRVRMLAKEVMELATGSIVELDRAAGEPVDVLVNGRAVARGEVVVIEDNFGVRVTEILSPIDRLKRLGDRE
ncbi:MAG: hypothetical protein AMXMBFR61_26300 [Fimbriimonadales bacterium]